MDQGPVVVRLTPPGRGAVAVLAVEGPGASAAVASLFRCASGRPLEAHGPGRLVFGHFGPEMAEEAVVRLRSEESLEVHCHGGQAAVGRAESLLIARGCRKLAWRQWMALHHGDPIAAAAGVALAEARTWRTAAILLDQHQGALRRALDDILQALARGEAVAAAQQIDGLLGRTEIGRHLTEPWQVVLAGPPNAGKSSLANRLLGYPRAIVHPTAGTTRDIVAAPTAIEGWPIELSDTAGLGETDHPIELAGMHLARRKLAEADLVVLVFDASQAWSARGERVLHNYPRALVVHNKIDLTVADRPSRPSGVLVSAATGEGADELVQAIASRLVPEELPEGAAVPFAGVQVDCLRAAAAAIRRGNLSDAKAILLRL